MRDGLSEAPSQGPPGGSVGQQGFNTDNSSGAQRDQSGNSAGQVGDIPAADIGSPSTQVNPVDALPVDSDVIDGDLPAAPEAPLTPP